MFGRVDQQEGAFPLKEGKRRCNWLAPAKRRVAGIGGVIPRAEELLPRAPVPAVPLPWAPGRLCLRLNAYVTNQIPIVRSRERSVIRGVGVRSGFTGKL